MISFRCRNGADGYYDESAGGDDTGNCNAFDSLGLNNKGPGTTVIFK